MPEQVTDQLALNWKALNIFGGLGETWYTGIVLWWGLFVATVVGLILLFSGAFL